MGQGAWSGAKQNGLMVSHVSSQEQEGFVIYSLVELAMWLESH